MTVKKLSNEQIDYIIEVLTQRLVEDCGKYVQQELVKRSADEGDAMSIIFGGLMKDTSLDSNVQALNAEIGHLQSIKE